jgi:hypothetical protein
MGWSCNLNGERRRRNRIGAILVGKLHGELLFLTSKDKYVFELISI